VTEIPVSRARAVGEFCRQVLKWRRCGRWEL
jgi:hypothetical protein